MKIEGEDTYFSAEDARKVSAEVSNQLRNRELDEIYKKIDSARFNGKTSVTFVNKKFMDDTVNFLKNKGFKVTHWYGDQRDPANDTTISW